MVLHLYTYDDPPSERDLAKVVEVLEHDGVIAYPTDLNWAFGCDARSQKALDRINLLKPSHPKALPYSLICSSISMASDYVVIDNTAYAMVKKAWPGPYTILFNTTRNLPRQLKDKRRIAGIRIPDSNLLRAVVDRLGRPLATTSIPEHPRFGYEVEEQYGHALDIVLDLGQELEGRDSTIIDFTGGSPELIRLGAGDPQVFGLSTTPP